MDLWQRRIRHYEKKGREWEETSLEWDPIKKERAERTVQYYQPVLDLPQIAVILDASGVDKDDWDALIDIFEVLFISSRRNWTSREAIQLEREAGLE